MANLLKLTMWKHLKATQKSPGKSWNVVCLNLFNHYPGAGKC